MRSKTVDITASFRLDSFYNIQSPNEREKRHWIAMQYLIKGYEREQIMYTEVNNNSCIPGLRRYNWVETKKST